jgi:hypothetical protein
MMCSTCGAPGICTATIDNLRDPMQKLAFTFYTNLVEIAKKSEQLFED